MAPERQSDGTRQGRPSTASAGEPDGAEDGVAESPDATDAEDARYLEVVLGEIDEEVRTRRAAGDLPPRMERELDDLFLQFAPVGGTQGQEVSEALRGVDAAAFVNPVVPLASDKSGGAIVKRGVRTLSMWYIDYVTQQVNRFTAATSRCLHVVEGRLSVLEREMARLRSPTPEVIEGTGSQQAGAWWVDEARRSLAGVPGRVVHMAAGDGWLVGALRENGVDAYGVDPRAERIAAAEADTLDLRSEPPLEHLRAVATAGLGGVVLSGVVEPMEVGEHRELLDVLDRVVAPGGAVLVHSMDLGWWLSDEAPPEADLVRGRPLRAATWQLLLGQRGYETAVHRPARDADDPARRSGPAATAAPDYVVVARREELPANTRR